MRVIKVVVDEIPQDCELCKFSYYSITARSNGSVGINGYVCRLMEIYRLLPHEAGRHEDCPLEVAAPEVEKEM